MTLVDLRPGLYKYLLDDAAIAASVGHPPVAGQKSRIFPLVLPAGETRTSIAYSRISAQGDHHNGGPSGLAQTRLQIDCWSETIGAASALANLVKQRIDGFRGTMPDTSSPPVEMVVRGVFFENEREDYDGTLKMYRVSRDYFFWYAER